MNEIMTNDKVNYDYNVYVCVNEELSDMMAIVNHVIKEYSYHLVSKVEDNGNTIITLSRKKKK